jgi:hypothetical protein
MTPLNSRISHFSSSFCAIAASAIQTLTILPSTQAKRCHFPDAAKHNNFFPLLDHVAVKRDTAVFLPCPPCQYL